jgi:hypothetical protein
MKKYAADIEKSMAFLMSQDLGKSLNASDAVSHLSKARNLLENLGLTTYSSAVSAIIKRAELIDESDIEVQG